MERKNRLNASMDIQKVRRSGKSIAHPFFVLIHLADPQMDHTLIGVVASKAVGGAVERNRAKRVLRSAADALREEIAPKQMVLILARKPILEHDTPEITEILRHQLKKAGIYLGKTNTKED